MKWFVCVLIFMPWCASASAENNGSGFRSWWYRQQATSLVEAAESGHYRAQLSLADKALLSIDSGSDKEQLQWAVYWLEKAAQSGRPEAQYLLAKALLLQTRSDTDKRGNALSMLRDSAEQDWVPAQVLLADQIRESDPDEAISWLRRAAGLNSSVAQLALGRLAYRGGQYPEALGWLKRASKDQAEALALMASIRMSESLSYHEGVETVSLLSRAYDGGFDPALLLLAQCYALGIGVDVSLRSARRYLLMAVDKKVPEAQQYLFNVPIEIASVSESEILQWTHQQAKAGSAAAMNWLGMLWRRGESIEQDFAMARYWYEQAASEGFAPAMSNLGALYEQGLGVPVDLAKAQALYQKAQIQGHERGAINLAVLLVSQRREIARAVGLLQQYPENPRALFSLGQIYETGLLSDRSIDLARQYYSQAAELGYQKAREKLSSNNF